MSNTTKKIIIKTVLTAIGCIFISGVFNLDNISTSMFFIGINSIRLAIEY